jgi:hypothetical protein
MGIKRFLDSGGVRWLESTIDRKRLVNYLQARLVQAE